MRTSQTLEITPAEAVIRAFYVSAQPALAINANATVEAGEQFPETCGKIARVAVLPGGKIVVNYEQDNVRQLMFSAAAYQFEIAAEDQSLALETAQLLAGYGRLQGVHGDLAPGLHDYPATQPRIILPWLTRRDVDVVVGS